MLGSILIVIMIFLLLPLFRLIIGLIDVRVYKNKDDMVLVKCSHIERPLLGSYYSDIKTFNKGKIGKIDNRLDIIALANKFDFNMDNIKYNLFGDDKDTKYYLNNVLINVMNLYKNGKYKLEKLYFFKEDLLYEFDFETLTFTTIEKTDKIKSNDISKVFRDSNIFHRLSNYFTMTFKIVYLIKLLYYFLDDDIPTTDKPNDEKLKFV